MSVRIFSTGFLIRNTLLLLILVVALPVQAALININTAGSTGLQTLTGIGPAYAQRIIDYRTTKGLFQKIEDIKNVSGIGEVTFAKIKDYITVGDKPAEASVPAENLPATNTTTSTSSDTGSSHYSATLLSSVDTQTKLEVGAGRSRLGTTGTPMEFKAETYNRLAKDSGLTWSFGDGTVGGGPIVVHTYMYPGEYIVVLNTKTTEGEAVSRTNVKILDPEVSISYASQDRIEIYNKSKEEINMFGRAIMFGEKMFIFPKDTIIGANQKISFPSFITGLTPMNVQALNLFAIGENINTLDAKKKFNEYKTGEVSRIKNEIDILQKQLAAVRSNEISTKTESLSVQNEPKDDNSNQSATVILADKSNTKSNWFGIIKKFFLNKN